MFNDFENDPSEDMRFSVERYEEMIRNKDLYFFDTEAFENIIDYYLDKNDPIKSLQVIEYATSQHPYAPVFMIKQAQLLLLTNQNGKALELLDQARSEEHTSELQSLMRISYAVFCLKKKTNRNTIKH